MNPNPGLLTQTWVFSFGNQAFTFIGAAAFTALGQARYAGGILEFNNTGNTGADMQIALTGAPTLLGTDILL